MLAIIGGSGLTQLKNLVTHRREVVRTPYGEPSSPVSFGSIGDVDVVFLARHGFGHTIAPHEINYRANMWALQSLGVREVVAVGTVGGISAGLAPGQLVVPDQILDYTHGRKQTYYESADRPVVHVDFTEPYCADMRGCILDAAQRLGEPCGDGGVYAAVQGPRLETRAEIDRLDRDGADMVGMTGMPEAVLARELDLCYACLAVVVNEAAGRGASSKGIRHEDIAVIMERAMEKVGTVLENLCQEKGR